MSLGILTPEIGDFREIPFSFFNFQIYELKSISFDEILTILVSSLGIKIFESGYLSIVTLLVP